jgi:UDP-glucose 4-epimerase
MTIVDAVLRELGQRDTTIYCTGGAQGWPGDQPRVQLDVSKLRELGWSARHSSTQAVRIAAERMVAQLSDPRPALPAVVAAEVR